MIMVTEYWNYVYGHVGLDTAIMILCFVYVLFHRPWRSDFRLVDPVPRSNWMPKESKHPLIEMDKELKETEQLERMWKL